MFVLHKLKNICKYVENEHSFKMHLKILLRVLQVLGIAPCFENDAMKTICGIQITVWHRLWSMLLLFLIYTLCYIECNQCCIHSNMIPMVKIFDTGGFVMQVAIITLGMMYSYVYAAEYEFIATNINRVHKKLQYYAILLNANIPNLYVNLLPLLLAIVAFIIIDWSIAFPFVGIEVNVEVIRKDVTYALPLVIIFLIITQYWIPMKLLLINYCGCNQVLVALATAEKSQCTVEELDVPPFKCWTAKWYQHEFSESQRLKGSFDAHMKSVLDIYLQLDALLTRIEKIFGSIFILSFLLIFLQLSLNIYAVFNVLDDQSGDGLSNINFLGIAYRVLWVVVFSFFFFFKMLVVNEIKKEVT